MTTTFDHRYAGTAAADWAALIDGLPGLAPPGAGDTVLVLAAHPDDETLGAGGLMAAAITAGARVQVIVASDGAASHPASRTHSPSTLARLRRQEADVAMQRLGVTELEWLGLPDGGLADRAADLAAAVASRSAGCTHVLTPWLGDRHPDHAACARAGAVAAGDAMHWQFPIWGWHWARPGAPPDDWRRLHRLELPAAARRAKAAAIAAYRSQHQPLSGAPGDEAIVGPQMLAHFGHGSECFVLSAPAATAGYFDALYTEADDPWGLAERFYESRKRELLLAALPRGRFRRAFEPGCATGLLTERLAARCAQVVAWDGAERPLVTARARAAGERVQFEQRRIPAHWPAGRFDLIVLSEVGYYCADLDALAERVSASLDDNGVLVACHWRRPAPHHPHTAAAVHDAVGVGLHRLVHHVEDDFLLDVWSRDPRSVAAATGVVD